MSTAAPAISCAALARQLPALNDRYETLDLQGMKLRRDTPEGHSAVQAMDAVMARIIAVEDLILVTPPETLADATAALLVAAGKVTFARDFQDCEKVLEQTERALHAVLPVVAAAAGVNLHDFGVEDHAPFSTRPLVPAEAAT